MTTRARLRKTAVSLPEAAEQSTRSGSASFTVRDKPFASVDQDEHVQLYLPSAEADEFLAAHPAAVRLTRGALSVGVRVPLEGMNGRQLHHWVRRAWLSRAPKRLAAQPAAADAATPGAVGDLPRSIGGPATRALLGAGIATLDQVAQRTEPELLAMHGVGPKAVRLLGEALSATGRLLRG
ncbi:hypothetical protein ACFWU3_06620 [Streptomyces sp. NPDC058685]|uniref:hypothetical protein n=1 Tax=Streptomyces sp. NPDC058685 TaxID=3346598 RepID=UPI00364BEF7D